MSSCEVIQLPPSDYLDLYAHQLPEVLRPILHTIIFHRSLGLIRPQEVDSELFDLTWVHCGDQEVDRKVDEKIVQFTSWLEKNPGKRAQVCLSFYEKRQKAAWFGSQEQRLYWEQWNINLKSRTDPGTPEEQAEQQQRTQVQLEECILSTIRTVSERRDAIPPVVSSGTVTFPFDITIAGEGGSVFGLEVVRRMLSTAQPPSVLH